MNDRISHRGPDDDGCFVSEAAGLAMRRLSIIDLSGGAQPIYNETGDIAIVFNGEIYNHAELRPLLEERGHRFRTSSDTEAIVHAYEEWGDDCAAKLRGMFVFAIWDQRRQKLVVARDRLGKKPLYYWCTRGRIVFASEIKSILEDRSAPRTINPRALDAYISLGYVPAPDTLFAGILKLPAGHTLTFESGRLSIRQYWDLHFQPDDRPTFAEHCERVHDLLADSVRARLMSDVPLGAFLSGGIDSSVVVGLMSGMMSQPVDTFSVGFDETGVNELPYARVVAEYFATNHHEIVVDTCDADLLDTLVWHLDEPVADPAAVPTYLVSALARQHVKVVLTGEGGDELFGGYDYYRWSSATGIDTLPAGVRRRVIPGMARGVNTMLGRPRYHDRTIWYWSLPREAQLAAWVAVFTDREKAQLYTPEFQQHLGEHCALESLMRHYDPHSDDRLHQHMYIDTKVWLPDDLLMKVDKTSMAHSIEARTPYLDHHLMEYCATIPEHYKLHHGASKALLKEVAKSILPEQILTRKKQTFDVPIGTWLNGPLREPLHDIVAQGIIPGSGIFEPAVIRDRLLRDLQAGKPGSARQAWSLLNLAMWTRRYDVQAA
jgi:asparagine synthase (glutamine-hydrolysing)